jgi:general secretion pathway protein K
VRLHEIHAAPQPQRGVAVVTALLLTALVAVLVSGMVWSQHVSIRRLENQGAALQLRWIARGGLEWARLILSGDARSSSADHLGEPWAAGLSRTPLSESLLDAYAASSESLGEISGRMTDLQGRFNVDRLNRSGRVDPDALAILTALVQRAGGSPEDAERFAARFVAASQPAALAAGQPWIEPGQLAAAPELQAAWPQLADHVTWLPRNTRINVNTAGAAVLAAALPGISESDVRSLIESRDQAHLRNVSEIGQRLGNSAANIPTQIFSTDSRYFLVEGEIRYGRLTRRFDWVIERNGRASQVLWQRES